MDYKMVYNTTMKVFIIAALTTDGFIAKDENHSAFWTSKDDKKRFVELTKRAGVVVMGSRTFSTLPRPLKERLNIVYSRTKTAQSFSSTSSTSKTDMATTPVDESHGTVEITQAEPRELIQSLEARGFKEVAICGGSQIYNSFIKAGVVDYLYLTVEPLLFGAGIKLFTEPMNVHLHLEKAKATPGGTVLLDYKVDYHHSH